MCVPIGETKASGCFNTVAVSLVVSVLRSVRFAGLPFRVYITSSMSTDNGEGAEAKGPLFYEAFKACPLGTALENLEGQFLFVNPALCSMLGFSEEEMRNRHCVEFSPPEDAASDSALFEQLRAGQINSYQIERRFFRRDGSLIWGRLTISLLKARPALVVAIVEDITERKKIEEALRESEERFRLAAQAGKMFAYEWDAGTDVIVRSPEAARILRIDESALVSGQQILAKVHPDDRERVTAAIAALCPAMPYLQISYRMIRGDGTTVWVERNSRAHFDKQGRILRVVGMVADITERKVAEEALRTSEERLRLAQKIAHIGTFERGIRTGVLTWTSELESMYGLPPGGFGKTISAFENMIHPDDRAGVAELVDHALKTGQPAKGEWRVIWPDSSVHWIAGRWQVLTDESGEPSRVVGVNMDITERKRAEGALAGMTRKLVEAQEEERARIARELHDDVSQRLVLLTVELDQLRGDPSTIRSRVKELQKKISDISNDIQVLSHDLHSSRLEYMGVAAGMKSWCREFAERQKLEIDFRHDVSSALPTEIGMCLFRVLQEALHNAAKHSGVKRMEVQLHEESRSIYLIVSDPGRGFDVKAVEQGKGLGLISMRERIRLVNGTFTIESKPLSGTTIRVQVPFRSEEGLQRAAG